MAYPALRPSSRSVSLGDWPVKSFRAQNGKEIRFLYGDKRTGQELQLTYENISDTTADSFRTHYGEVKGTFGTFQIDSATRAGWNRATPSSGTPFDEPTGNVYRYAEAPQISSIRPGLSTVTVRLVSVLQ